MRWHSNNARRVDEASRRFVGGDDRVHDRNTGVAPVSDDGANFAFRKFVREHGIRGTHPRFHTIAFINPAKRVTLPAECSRVGAGDWVHLPAKKAREVLAE